MVEVHGGRADGAPRARNVNWEDCFNKVLISADAGRRLAGGATQTGGQLTVRFCQKTYMSQCELSCIKLRDLLTNTEIPKYTLLASLGLFFRG